MVCCERRALSQKPTVFLRQPAAHACVVTPESPSPSEESCQTLPLSQLVSSRSIHRCTLRSASLAWRQPCRVSGRTETKTYGSAADTRAFQTLTGRKASVKGRLLGESSMWSLSRKECLKMKKDNAQPFENTLLFAMTFPKRSFLGTVAYVVHYEMLYFLP